MQSAVLAIYDRFGLSVCLSVWHSGTMITGSGRLYS